MKFIAGILLSVLMLTGCSVHIDSKPSEPKQSSTVAYVQEIRAANVESAEGVPDADLIDLGRSECHALDNGATIPDMATLYMQQGFDPYDAGVYIRASILHLCPEHKDVLDTYVKTGG